MAIHRIHERASAGISAELIRCNVQQPRNAATAQSAAAVQHHPDLGRPRGAADQGRRRAGAGHAPLGLGAWSQGPDSGYSMINARAETVAAVEAAAQGYCKAANKSGGRSSP